MPRDFLEEIIAERTRRNPEFPRLLQEAEIRHKAARKLSAQREKAGLKMRRVIGIDAP